MKHMATKTSEKVYDVLVRFAEAASNYYQKESFVYHFGVVHGTANKYKLTCMDGGIRHFICNNDGDFWVDGTKTGKVNAILRKIAEEAGQDAV
jgi:hypothetical protein